MRDANCSEVHSHHTHTLTENATPSLFSARAQNKCCTLPIIFVVPNMSPSSQNTVTTLLTGVVAGAALCFIGIKAAATELLSKSKNKPVERSPGIKSWRMSKWIKHNGILRTQGLCGDFSKMPSSTAQQTAEALEKLDGILKDAGITRKHLLSMTIYIADISKEMRKAVLNNICRHVL